MSEPDQILVQLGTAHHALSEARSVQDAKKIADVAAAASIFARRVKLSQETVDYALEIKLRAERLLGEILAKTPKHEGGRPGKTSTATEQVSEKATLAELGIDRKLSSRAQKLAAVPPKVFEKKMAEGERRPTAFFRKPTKESTIHDPLGGFVHTLGRLRKNDLEHFAEIAVTVKEEPDAVDLYNRCYDGIERISAVLDTLETAFPQLKGTRE